MLIVLHNFPIDQKKKKKNKNKKKRTSLTGVSGVGLVPTGNALHYCSAARWGTRRCNTTSPARGKLHPSAHNGRWAALGCDEEGARVR